MPKRSENPKLQPVAQPVDRQKAKLYAFWFSLPLFYRKNKPEFIKELGFEIPAEIEEVLEVRSKLDFEKKYKVSRQTLSRWEISEWFKKDVAEFERITDVRNLRKDVDASFTRKTIKEGDANRVKLWKQLYGGYKEETETTVKFKWE